MSAVWQKIVADLFRRRAISILITITIAVAAALLTLALSTLMNLGGPYDKLFEELNSAHLWLHFTPGRVSSTDINRIEALPGVVSSTGRQYSYNTQIRVDGERLGVSLRVFNGEQAEVHRLMRVEGRYPVPGTDEVLVEKFLSNNFKISVGDTVIITDSTGEEVLLPVVGIVYDPMYDTYRSSQPPYLFLSEDALRRLFPNKDAWNWSLGLRLADAESVDAVVAEIKSMRSLEFVENYTDWHDARESSVFNVQLTFVFLSAFSLFAIFATVLIVVSVVSSSVLSQIRQIGILKALGFTGRQILSFVYRAIRHFERFGHSSGICSGIGAGSLAFADRYGFVGNRAFGRRSVSSCCRWFFSLSLAQPCWPPGSQPDAARRPISSNRSRSGPKRPSAKLFGLRAWLNRWVRPCRWCWG